MVDTQAALHDALSSWRGVEPEEVQGVASTSDGTRVVTVSSKGTARLWDMATQACLYELEMSIAATVCMRECANEWRLSVSNGKVNVMKTE
eukprot:scaffold670812_cov66-Prasinocladus_malaysianus.AAC.1